MINFKNSMKSSLFIFFAIVVNTFSSYSQSLGSVNLSQIVYGDNETKTSYFNNPNSAYFSGFYNNYTGTNMPYQAWWHMIINRHTNTENNYQFQIAADFSGDNTYFRKIDAGTPTPWRRILNDGQDTYAATLNQSLSTTDNVRFGRATIQGSGDCGSQLHLINTSKTANGQAYRWSIFNMTSGYGNSLQFWNYDKLGDTYQSGGMWGSVLTLMDNANVGIGTVTICKVTSLWKADDRYRPSNINLQ